MTDTRGISDQHAVEIVLDRRKAVGALRRGFDPLEPTELSVTAPAEAATCPALPRGPPPRHPPGRCPSTALAIVRLAIDVQNIHHTLIDRP
ncbi:hypothetical protein ACFQ7N_10380 [Streptomyces niveus]|uniref:hypothetical protein n=1 Tax=Streptomyces niveus TaxID=193462 RepID=UPI003691706D